MEGKNENWRSEFKKIDVLKCLVYTFEFEAMAGHIIMETVAFKERNGKATVTATSLFQNMAVPDDMLNSGIKEGASEVRIVLLICQ